MWTVIAPLIALSGIALALGSASRADRSGAVSRAPTALVLAGVAISLANVLRAPGFGPALSAALCLAVLVYAAQRERW